MTFELPDAYVWDFWTTYDETAGRHHVFFLHAPSSLGDPDLRHRAARIGHAVSDDLFLWERLEDPLPTPADFDDLAQWTGCTVRGPDAWWLFTTGISRSDDGAAQRIGSATSPDLVTWTRTDLTLEGGGEAWRDPCVVRDEAGLWHMYITAADEDSGSGVVGHAVSTDLLDWEVGPPLSASTGPFQQLETIQVVQVEGRWVLVFSCLSSHMPGAVAGSGGVWSVPVDGPGAPVDAASAVRVTDESVYVGKVVHDLGAAYLMAFRNQGPDGRFVGGLTDPVPVIWRPDGRGLALDVPDPA